MTAAGDPMFLETIPLGDMAMSQSADEIRLVRVVPYGSAGYRPVNKQAGCPLWHYYRGDISCISSSGGSLCSGYLGHVNHDTVRCGEENPMAD